MNTSQAIDYLEAVNDIAPREMSRPMFKLVRAAARIAQRTYPGMRGYYDPESDCVRAEPWKFLFGRVWYTKTIPQSKRLLELTAPKYPEPFNSCLIFFGA